MANKKADFSTIVLIVLLVVFVIGMILFTNPSITGFAVVTSGDTRLEIYDETNTIIKYPKENIIFYANYTNLTDGTPITGECNITFEDSINDAMVYSSGLYIYNRTFSTNGTFQYNITCTNESYETLTATENVSVTALPKCDSCENCTILARFPGRIELQNNIGTDTGSCVIINSSDIYFECNNHEIYAGSGFFDAGIDAYQNGKFKNLTVHTCFFTGGRIGYFSSADNSSDRYNSANGTTYGRYSYNETNTIIEENSGGSYGREIGYNNIIVEEGNNITIERNFVSDRIELINTNNSKIRYNYNQNHTINGGAIRLQGSSNNNISGNYLTDLSGHDGDEGCVPPSGYMAYAIEASSESHNNIIQENEITQGSVCWRLIKTRNSENTTLNSNTIISDNWLLSINLDSNLTLINQNVSYSGYGSKIVWNNFNGVLRTASTYYSTVSSNFNYVSVDSSAVPELNTSARVSLYCSDYCNPPVYYYNSFSTDYNEIISNGQICNETTTPSCTNFTYSTNSVSFNVEHFDSYGVNSSSCPSVVDNFYVENNLTLCSGTYTVDDVNGDGLFIVNASNIVIDCNGSTLNGDGINDIAFYIKQVNNVTIKNCNLDNYSIGFKIERSNNNSFYNNNFTNGVGVDIYLQGGYNSVYNNRFENNTVAENIYVEGPSLVGCVWNRIPPIKCQEHFGDLYFGKNNIYNNIFKNDYVAIHLITQSSGLYHPCDFGQRILQCNYPTTNNTIRNNNIIDATDTAIWLTKTSDNFISNLNITNSTNYDFYGDNGVSETIFNTSYDKSKVAVALSGSLYFVWPTIIKSVPTSTITIVDAFDTLIDTLTTNTQGYAYINLTEYEVTTNGGTNYSPFNFTATKSGYYTKTMIEIINQSKLIDLTLTAFPSEEKGGGGAGGGAAPFVESTINNIDFTQKDSYDVKLSKQDIVNIKTSKGTQHTFRIIKTDTVKKLCIIEIASNPKNYTIKVGETIQIDYEDDGTKDLEITLKSFDYYWTFILRELNKAQAGQQVIEIPKESTAPVEIRPEKPIEQPKPEKPELKTDYTWIGTLLFFGLFIAIFLSIAVTRRKHELKTEVQEAQKPIQEFKPTVKETKPEGIIKPAPKPKEIPLPNNDLSRLRELEELNRRIDEINKDLRRF